MLTQIKTDAVPWSVILALILSACGNGLARPINTQGPTITPTIAATPTRTPWPTRTPRPTRTSTSTPLPTTTPFLPAVFTAIAPIASRQGVPGSADYNPSEPGPHRVVLLTEDGLPHEWNDSLPTEWLPLSVNEIELVIVVGQEKEVAIGSAYYRGGDQVIRVFRYRFELDVLAREVSTGRNLRVDKVRGSMPKDFPRVLPAGRTRIDGDHVSVHDLRSWMKCNIVTPEIC